MNKYHNIRDANAHASSFWDWSFLNEALSIRRPALKFSDLDLMLCANASNVGASSGTSAVERHGYFLALETKPPGGSFTGGQDILLKQIAKQKNENRQRNWMVLVLRGPQNITQEWRWLDVQSDQWIRWRPSNNNKLITVVKSWRIAAEKGGQFDWPPEYGTPEQIPEDSIAQPQQALIEEPQKSDANEPLQEIKTPTHAEHCAGCYEIEPGRWIHPPRNGGPLWGKR